MRRSKINSIKKKGFVLLSPPVILACLTLLSILGIYLSNSNITEKYKNEFKKDGTTIIRFMEAIFYEGGYENSVEQPWCSDAQTLTTVTVQRVINCSSLRNINYKKAASGQENIPIESYLKLLTRFNKGCNLYVKEVTGIANQMYLFIECDLALSKVPLEKVEADYVYFFRQNFPNEFVDEKREALDLDTDTGGTWEDGKVRITFEK